MAGAGQALKGEPLANDQAAGVGGAVGTSSDALDPPPTGKQNAAQQVGFRATALETQMDVAHSAQETPAAQACDVPATASAASQAASQQGLHEPRQLSSNEFFHRLVGDDSDYIASLSGACVEAIPGASAKEKLSTVLSQQPPVDQSLNVGSDAPASVVAHFCDQYSADPRTTRTMADVLVLLKPPLSPAEMWLCLAALVRRFAPVALLSGAGEVLVLLCKLFESLLLYHDPEVALLLKRANVGAEMYCVPWLCTAHASGMASLHTVLHVWTRWLDGGEHLDPVIFGLARLSICRDELLLCGPVPELAQLMHASLGTRQHAAESVAEFGLKRAAALRAKTPLSFLKRLQDALLRPAVAKTPAKPQPGEIQQSAVSAGPGVAQEGQERPSQCRLEEDNSNRDRAPLQVQAMIGRATAWLPNLRIPPTGKYFPQERPASRRPPIEPISCMKVEAQDVMMLETVKERVFDRIQAERIRRKAQADSLARGENATNSDGTSPSSVAQPNAVNCAPTGSDSKVDPDVLVGDGLCRLVPRLIDLRHPVEANREGIKGAMSVSVVQKAAAERFAQWAEEKAKELGNYHLTPMHVMMTSSGVLNPEQETFLRTILAAHIPNVCILSGGYASLVPYFIPDDVSSPSIGIAEAQAVLAAGAQEAKGFFKKGVNGLQSLWDKAPTRENLLHKMPSAPSLTSEPSVGSTFERAPFPPEF